MDNWGDFSALLKTGMRKKGISLRELCRRAKVDPSFLSKVFAGKRNPPLDGETLSGLARALDLRPSEIFVSVGRIPSEWERIRTERGLFEKVNRIIAGGGDDNYAEQPVTEHLENMPDELL